MRVVIDTNVLVSAALKDRSLPALALRVACRRGTLLKSLATESQALEVLRRPRIAALVDPAAVTWLSEQLAMAEAIVVTERISACRDATDDKFLELAVSGSADAIISGDNDLLIMHPFRSIPILSPAAFVQMSSRG